MYTRTLDPDSGILIRSGNYFFEGTDTDQKYILKLKSSDVYVNNILIPFSLQVSTLGENKFL